MRARLTRQPGSPRNLGVVNFENITIEHHDPFVTVRLANPAKRNALSLTTMTELIAAFEALAESPATAIIVAGEGPVFSAGHDFADMAGRDFAFLEHLLQTCTKLMTLVQQVPQPVIAKVHALATAAGCQLVASCDLAMAADTAHFALPGGKGGLFCHTPLVAVARNIGRKRALELSMTGDPIDAATAADWGLINHAVPAAELDAATLDLARRVTRGSRHARAVGKSTYYQQIDFDQTHAYDFAIQVMATNAVGPDGQEGINSFLEKRTPEWTQ